MVLQRFTYAPYEGHALLDLVNFYLCSVMLFKSSHTHIPMNISMVNLPKVVIREFVVVLIWLAVVLFAVSMSDETWDIKMIFKL